MSPQNPLVSIVTPSFNQAQFLEQAIRSVGGQDYPRIEHIVVDGGSTDGSLEILEAYSSDLALWMSEPDSGQAEAINKGLTHSHGEVVAWLNSDDVYMPGAVAEAVETLHRNPDAGMVYSDGLMVDSDLTLLDPHRYRSLSSLDLLKFEIVLQPTVFMRRSVLEQVGFLNEDFHLVLDHELWLRISSISRLQHVPRYWALERTHSQAKTIQLSEAFVEEAHELVKWAESSEQFGPLVRERRSEIHAGLNVFSARRLIDAGLHWKAVSHLAQAIRLHPPTVTHYWYKVVQGFFSMLGLEGLFMSYRRMRRQLQFGRMPVRLHYLESDWTSSPAISPASEVGPASRLPGGQHEQV